MGIKFLKRRIKMKIELIHPVFIKDKKFSGDRVNKEECLSLATLAGYIPEKYEIKITDETVEKINFNSPAEIIAITVNTFNAVRAYQLADIFRKQGRIVILGGVHVTACPHEAKSHADAIVCGEGDYLFPVLFKDLASGTLKPVYKSKEEVDLQSLPEPRYDLLRKSYWPLRIIQTSRGCPFQCDFCSLKFMYGNKIRYYPVKRIVKLCETSPYSSILFADDNLYLNNKHTRRILQELQGMKKYWGANVSINAGDDEEWLKLAKKSGCTMLLVGLETLFQQGLQNLHKIQNVSSRFHDQISRIRDNGISIIGCFIFGFDHEPRDIFKRTLDFVLENKIDFICCSALTPFPGTVLYKRLKEQKRLFHTSWWNEPFSWYDLLFAPRGELSGTEIEDGIFWLLDHFYSLKEIFKRLMYRLQFVPRKLSFYEYIMLIYGHFFEIQYSKDRRKKWKAG